MSERSVGKVRTVLTGKRARVGIAAATLAAGLVLGGCGAGQITQTDTQRSAVNGVNAEVGQIALRDAQLAYPEGTQPAYKQGSDARVVLTIVNNGAQDDQLAGVSSPWFDGSRLQGDKKLPARSSIRSGVDSDDQQAAPSSSASGSTPSSSASSSSSSSSSSPESSSSSSAASAESNAPSGAGPTHRVAIDLTGLKKQALRPGVTVPVHFQFSVAGGKTVQLPIGAAANEVAER